VNRFIIHTNNTYIGNLALQKIKNHSIISYVAIVNIFEAISNPDGC